MSGAGEFRQKGWDEMIIERWRIGETCKIECVPSTGEYTDEGTLVPCISGGVEVPTKPDNKLDWMLVLTAED